MLEQTNGPLTARRISIPGERPLLSGARSLSPDRGDVPGWVLITLMTAGLVLIIWGVAGPALTGVFEQAIDRVTSF